MVSRRIIVPTEKQEHLAFLDWVAYQPLIRELIVHNANEYDGGVIGGAKRKRMGIKKGLPDFTLYLPTKLHHGLLIELKRIKGYKISPEQLWWNKTLNSLGYSAHFCYGSASAILVTENYLKNLG